MALLTSSKVLCAALVTVVAILSNAFLVFAANMLAAFLALFTAPISLGLLLRLPSDAIDCISVQATNDEDLTQ